MGEILALRTPRHLVTTPAPERDAEILFFTGIRYERMSDAAQGHGLPDSRQPTESRDPPDPRRGAALL